MCNCVFDKGESCAVLTSRDCEKCTFKKTKRELIAGRERAKALIERLPQEQREAISNKYYRRKMFYNGI